MRGARLKMTRRSKIYLANFNDPYLLSREPISVINLVPSGRGVKSERGSYPSDNRNNYIPTTLF